MALEVLHDWQRNLRAAGDAVKYVRGKMDIGTSNKFLPNFWGTPARVLCVAESRDHIVKDLASQQPDIEREGKDPMRATVDTWAYWSRHYGCGNCGEHSAMAFVYLRERQQIFPLDWMQINQLEHGFVVIGRAGVTNPADSSTWNGEAVICDPYKNEWMAASDCPWIRRREIGLIYREATG